MSSQSIEERNPFASHPRVWLVGVRLPGQTADEVDEHLDELAELTAAAGGKVVDRVVQRRTQPDPATFIGRGKAAELTDELKVNEVEVLLFDDDLSASQVKALEKITEVVVIDRSGLILEIFHQRAHTREAKTQVELARMRYLLPRLTRRWSHLSRQAGGIGVRGGEGESQLEADRRMLRRRIQRLEKDLAAIEKTRALQRRGRRRGHARQVALAGYTNAGKSTLFNLLTDAGVFVQDQVFATLDAKLRRGHLVNGHEVIWADTVGFIRKLPHHLVASFRSTLEQVASADIMLHVVDRSHPAWAVHEEVGGEVLEELGIEPRQVLRVYNKIDRLEDARAGVNGDACWISAETGAGVDALRTWIAQHLGLDDVGAVGDAIVDEYLGQGATLADSAPS